MRLRLKQRDVKFVLDAHAMCKYEQSTDVVGWLMQASYLLMIPELVVLPAAPAGTRRTSFSAYPCINVYDMMYSQKNIFPQTTLCLTLHLDDVRLPTAAAIPSAMTVTSNQTTKSP